MTALLLATLGRVMCAVGWHDFSAKRRDDFIEWGWESCSRQCGAFTVGRSMKEGK